MILALASALALAAAPAQATPAPQLNSAQQTSLKCAITLSIGTELQRRGDKVATGWPPLGDRAREFFVRVMAQLMDDTGMTHDDIAALVREQSKALADKSVVSRAMPGCVELMDKSGV
ncbi:MAG: hypothetical protein ABGW87_11565 [Sphingomonadaceae bacterium]